MAGAGGLAIILLAGFLGFLFIAGAFALLIFSVLTKKPRRGWIASLIALTISIMAALLSIPFWVAVISGHGTHGEPLHYDDDGPIFFLVYAEAFMIAVSALSVLRQRSRRMPRG